MDEPTAEATTTVEADGIHVEKSFTDDAFPVPAVLFELSSHREDAVRVRVVDRIPDSFPMDRIGFHPDYESENWTAYKDNRVEFERVLEPGESVETVFGIRDDDPDLEAFLGDPEVEHVPVGEEIEDVLGTGDPDAVREVLSGDRATLPGMEEESTDQSDRTAESTESAVDQAETEADTGAETEAETATDPESPDDADESPDPRGIDDGTTAAVTRREDEEDQAESTDESGPADGTEHGDESGSDTNEAADEETVEEDDPSEAESIGAVGEIDSVVDAGADGTDESSDMGATDGIAAALADEIRSGDVEEADLAVLRSELDIGIPRSVDVRIGRLQSSIADIEAYADALAEFIDEEGTAREILDGVDSRVDDVAADIEALNEQVAAGEDAREELAADVDHVEGAVSEVGNAVEDLEDDIETLYEEVDDAMVGVERTGERVDAVEERVDAVEERLDRLDEEFDDCWDDLAEVDTRLTGIEDRIDDDLAEVDTRLTGIEDRLGDDIEDVDAELAEINEHLEELESFRKRVNEAFSP